MMISSAGITVKGEIRLNNEDNFYLDGYYKEDCRSDTYAIAVSDRRDRHVYAVCDGMGGYSAGEDASLETVRQLKIFAGKRLESEEFISEEFITEANRAICRNVKTGSGDNAGTTIVMAVIKNGQVILSNLGDSRAYMMRNHKLKQMSEDHTRAQSMIRAGMMKPEEVEGSKESQILTQYLGIYETEFLVSPSVTQGVKLLPGDVILLCSDGLSGMIPDEEIREIIIRTQNEEPKRIAAELTAAALHNGGKDNITVVIVKVM